ncbi:homoserine O-acetyltransferase MetA [Methanomethylophilus alvi]|uniref:homoserine O-acetyltransferase MetA n=1 Tax=Methanomethylophilus alvi TaxID=1291540 RepID=UPI0037DBF467
MPIKVPNDLPAATVLENENMFVMRENRAASQDIRPLDLLILNLMPTKVETEIQIMRLLSNSPLQVNVRLLQMSSHVSKNTSQEYLDRFYDRFDDVKSRKWDGMIITGAPVENIDFEEVDYWDELCQIMEWSKKNVFSTLHICWGAQAGLNYHYGIPKYPLESKMSGVFAHKAIVRDDPLLRGCDDIFWFPHSRHTEVRAEDIIRNPHLHIIVVSDEAGVGIVVSENSGQVFITGHMEYDAKTLSYEYYRDLGKGMNPHIPYHYFPDDDPSKDPVMNWRSTANLIFTNWLNYYVYQRVPYDINEIGKDSE